ncbi:MAG: RHS repeat-associated core domain-containing protein [Methanocorpusculum sp.]|nr:RHS repeat-associated core domain-containing protein [Methanocorpusculum sp.]
MPQGFAGGIEDKDSGLVRFGMRDYDTTSGRWTARDPIFFEGGQGNLFVYVGNDPVNYVDWDGLWYGGIGASLEGNGFFGYGGVNLTIVFDDDWNIGIFSTAQGGQGAWLPEATLNLLIPYSPNGKLSNLPGQSKFGGGSVGAGLCGGFDISSTSDGIVTYTPNVGMGLKGPFNAEAHAGLAGTKTIVQINLRETYKKLLNKYGR